HQLVDRFGSLHQLDADRIGAIDGMRGAEDAERHCVRGNALPFGKIQAVAEEAYTFLDWYSRLRRLDDVVLNRGGARCKELLFPKEEIVLAVVVIIDAVSVGEILGTFS